MQIGATDLSDGLKLVLTRENIRTVAQLAACTRQQIRYLPGIGPSRLAEIDRLFALRGLAYAMISPREQQRARYRWRREQRAARTENPSERRMGCLRTA
jgi:hypothetical protein